MTHTNWRYYRLTHCTAYASESDIDELARPICLDMPRRYEPTLVLLDAGITVELSEYDQCTFRSVFNALVNGDGERIADVLIERAPDKGAHVVDRDLGATRHIITVLTYFR